MQNLPFSSSANGLFFFFFFFFSLHNGSKATKGNILYLLPTADNQLFFLIRAQIVEIGL